MRPLPSLSPRATGIVAALVTITIWTSFIVVARASSDPSRGGALNPFDLAMARLLGAGVVLLPLGWWLVRRDRARGTGVSSMFGLSPLSLRVTASVGLFGGLLYCVVAYSGFVYAPAGHAAVLLPGSLPLWTMLTVVVPGLAAGSVVLFLGEPLQWNLAAGLALVTLGILSGVRAAAVATPAMLVPVSAAARAAES